MFRRPPANSWGQAVCGANRRAAHGPPRARQWARAALEEGLRLLLASPSLVVLILTEDRDFCRFRGLPVAHLT
ncbi:MAG: hypothetical protein QN122_13760 [Armatimonadota bacterium]|nr:hypothetical protein [Armatimonadota bacterium]MDR7448823.1 hypothetical protein [Armatimonadota bacterium]MDR7459944.1 hypothetical protein [Armatimonadota bacterium]MDR7479607.1 hypothetical protein [Armatimonadota bacterium]MDR7488572.1 hypothetical protein [Armatimonadota bacterium]